MTAPNEINSGQPRHSALSPDGLTLLYTHPVSGGEIWMATRSTLSTPFGNPELVPAPVSTQQWDMPFSITNDQCLIIAARQSGVSRVLKYHVRSSPTEPWSEEFLLDIPLPEAIQGWTTAGFRLTSDGRALNLDGYFEGGAGYRDILVTRRVPVQENESVIFLDEMAEKSYEGFGHLYKPGRNANDARNPIHLNVIQSLPIEHLLVLHPTEDSMIGTLIYELPPAVDRFRTMLRTRFPGRLKPLFFEVWGDDKPLLKLPDLTQFKDEEIPVDVSVAGVRELKLVVRSEIVNSAAHLSMLHARLTRKSEK